MPHEVAGREFWSIGAYESAVDKALAETDDILATFGRLLRTAQIEAKTRRSSFHRVDLSDVFQSLAEAYGPASEDADNPLGAVFTIRDKGVDR